MIPLVLNAYAEAERAYITRLRGPKEERHYSSDSLFVEGDQITSLYAGAEGLLEIDHPAVADMAGDVVLYRPNVGKVERLLRAGSRHNTLLVTERCDQLCVMCSQPPKKTHEDRFDLLEQACLLAEPGLLIGISGGEPTLYKDRLLSMVERVLTERDDLHFHILTNAQHFEESDIEHLRNPIYLRVSWGIPLYAKDASLHDKIVGKVGAFERLETSMGHLILAGARVELRTVLLNSNYDVLPSVANYVSTKLNFIEAWSIMQLEHIGFAKGRWSELFVDHKRDFTAVGQALMHSTLHGVRAQLFNFPRCTVPPAFRKFAIASISDWKRKFSEACGSCSQKADCSGFFEWHPDEDIEATVVPL